VSVTGRFSPPDGASASPAAGVSPVASGSSRCDIGWIGANALWTESSVCSAPLV
jgi:hypothetical protein